MEENLEPRVNDKAFKAMKKITDKVDGFVAENDSKNSRLIRYVVKNGVVLELNDSNYDIIGGVINWKAYRDRPVEVKEKKSYIGEVYNGERIIPSLEELKKQEKESN